LLAALKIVFAARVRSDALNCEQSQWFAKGHHVGLTQAAGLAIDHSDMTTPTRRRGHDVGQDWTPIDKERRCLVPASKEALPNGWVGSGGSPATSLGLLFALPPGAMPVALQSSHRCARKCDSWSTSWNRLHGRIKRRAPSSSKRNYQNATSSAP